MKTVKPSIAVQRQIPQHIRENYPLFVEFIKAYYEYLEDNQQVEIEKVRDIDTSLDKFINQFRGEISNGIPVDKAADKRMLIKHLREFYASRGSEASYKFIFKVLFNQDAQLYYPSAQILRVSDGKWNQDVSIFVKSSAASPNLFALSGNFITISTIRIIAGKRITKTLRTHVERVLEYSAGTYELFIEREYANEIDVYDDKSKIGSTISFTDSSSNEYSGLVLQCPAKLSIDRPGKNFKVGQIFALKTQFGRGCVVKVTKVGPLGEILRINLITIGLDYQTTFYSYLSDTKIISDEYVHPAKINTPYNSSNPIYNDNTAGFQDYGFALKQTYFGYDTSIPVEGIDRDADRFFADPSYVGDLSAQFYSDDTTNPIDENIAVIKIELGSVAKYPGYYMSQDGFISDEMYIQDGNYYQAFSYVIKVEEELRKYASLIKKILHPAGLKMFSEYTINNVVSYASIIQALKRVISKVDTTLALDQGYNWTDYIPDVSQPGSYIPAPGATKVYSSFGSAALFPSKALADSSTVYDFDTTVEVKKRFKVRTIKLFRFEIQPVDVSFLDYKKPLSDTINAEDNLEIDISSAGATSYTKSFNDDITITDTLTSAITIIRTFGDSINIVSSGYISTNPYDAEEYFASADEYNLAKQPIT